MKKFFTTLILVFWIFIAGFAQSQELNTLIETLVRPDNLDSYFEHQIDYYQEYYEELKLEVEEMIEDEKSIKKRIQAKKKIRKKDQEILKEVNERLALLREDLSFIKKFISIWKSYENFDNKMNMSFYENYDSNACYLIETEYDKLDAYEYEITYAEVNQTIKWKEFVEKVNQYGKERIEIAPASTKWVKRKADKNCLSADPNDCMVWCLVEVPAQYKTIKAQSYCPEDFQISLDKKYCHRTISVINEKEKTKRLVIKDIDFLDREILIKDYSVIDCKN